MRAVITSLHAPEHADSVLVEESTPDGSVRTHTYGEMCRLVGALRQELDVAGASPGSIVGLVAGNTAGWLVGDLALLESALVEVPVPLAFSAEQAASLLIGADLCLADAQGVAALERWGLTDLRVLRVDERHGAKDAAPAPEAIASQDRVVKVIHTSGTTGTPKGVRIRRDGIEALIESLTEAAPAHAWRRYLSVVPLSLLIEQVTALYLPIVHGGSVVFLPEDRALLGTAGSRAADILDWLLASAPSSSVLPPAAVSALAKAAGAGDARFTDLIRRGTPFLFAGGAAVDPDQLRLLDEQGLRVHEGYGMSENSSVVSWNCPGAWRPGTVGRPLPHCQVSLSLEGELLVRSTSLFAGYTVEDPTSRPVDAQGWLHTGDRARIDEDGYITILGRVKNMIITSHGRNVSPEWVESRLRSVAGVNEAVIFGEGLEHIVALVVTDSDMRDHASLATRIHDHCVRALAETDRPARIVLRTDSEQLRSRWFTVTGRPQRALILTDLGEELMADTAALA